MEVKFGLDSEDVADQGGRRSCRSAADAADNLVQGRENGASSAIPNCRVSGGSIRNPAIAAVGLEAGPLSQWLHRGLSNAGLPVVLMETRQVKGALKAMPIKTDRRDAEGIARLLL